MKPAFLALLLLIGACSRNQSPADPPAEPQIGRSGAWLLFDGPITPASAQRVRTFLGGHPLTGLSINSGGGDVEAALLIGQLVRDQQLEVEVRHWCMSSCANYIFASGTRKRIADGAVVAWHGSPGHLHFLDITGRGSADPAVREFNAALAVREAEFLRAAGVDPFVAWFGKVAPYNVPNFYALSTADMHKFGIGNVVAPPGYGPAYLAKVPEGIRTGLVFISVDAEAVHASRPGWLR